MKILVYDSGYIDIEAPIYMSDEQREKFIEFFEKMFPNDVEVVEKEEKSKEFGEREINLKAWTIDEYELLLSPNSNEDLAFKMDRTEMSVKMQRGYFVPTFLAWLKKKGYSKPNKNLIKEFLKERGEE